MESLKKKVIYQIYVKSFMDSNGDGKGDIAGITMKLDYLKRLGADCLWLTPVFVSPMNDNGYDVADYYRIDPSFGTMEDLELLIAEAKMRGLGIMLDMVFNHTSTEHEWFRKAMAGDPKYKDYYIFRKGRGALPPTNWVSKFGGSAWEPVDGSDEYYLHLFDRTQADLNWENKDLRKELFDVVNFWIKKGVVGFRFDVVNLISKPETFEDDHLGDGRRFYTDGPRIHEYLKELAGNTFGRHQGMITVGEMSSTSIGSCVRYSNPLEEELSMVFNFHHLKVDYEAGDKWTLKEFDFMELKRIFNDWQTGMENEDGWMALFYNNHDQPRSVSRFGSDTRYHKESAKMLATSIHLMRGTPYIYQGEEFGMPNAYFEDISEYRDVESINYHDILKSNGMPEAEILEVLRAKSRDNGRTPVLWDDSDGHGFTSEVPWLPFAKVSGISAESDIASTDSIFSHYRKLIALRKEYDVISDGTFRMTDMENSHLISYIRCKGNVSLLVVNNFYEDETALDLSKVLDETDLDFRKCTQESVLISNYGDLTKSDDMIIIRPYESFALYVEDKHSAC
ncbi:alpha,alpha-phosphotrehalase [Youngiibacter fragilis]|uniref:Alpha,alpha-phosphotrehalase n=1 Tax=Youngiibacter fragilis 232.1 TaxID=994573 RepID=V7IAI3_9CLOT|nr:alpha,alpha-phosphotrehalase [Youngiibacter fragilis]ETA81867.1 trehalose-6-phosphate hydrolase [Youngiibacter fragilis 232.1]